MQLPDDPSRGAAAGGSPRVASRVAANAGVKRAQFASANPSSAHVVWQFASFDPLGPFASHVDGDGAAEMLRCLGEIEGVGLDQLFSTKAATGPGACRFVTLGDSQLISSAKERLADLKLDDFDGLFEMRVGDKGSVWLLRREHLVSVIWWDPGSRICPTWHDG